MTTINWIEETVQEEENKTASVIFSSYPQVCLTPKSPQCIPPFSASVQFLHSGQKSVFLPRFHRFFPQIQERRERERNRKKKKKNVVFLPGQLQTQYRLFFFLTNLPTADQIGLHLPL